MKPPKICAASAGLLALLMLTPLAANEPAVIGAASPVGWASTEGGTTGGREGETIRVTAAAGLIDAAGRKEPLTIVVAGTIRLEEVVEVGSHKTIVGGAEGATLVGGGLHLKRAENVILRNLAIREAPDGIGIEMGSRHVWIDHCDLSNCRDGLLDVKRGSDLVTVSWCRFHDHHKTSLVGHSDKDDIRAMDTGHLRVTYHHNFFDRTQTRHPRVRFAEPVHVFNNLFVGNEYGIASLMDAGTLVEGNVFESVEQPTLTKYGDSPLPGRLVERGNLFFSSGVPETAGTVAEPSQFYKYALEPVDQVAAKVRAGAGVLVRRTP
jgi:pectate lyase